MARLVYGVAGEGSGHSSRARVVLRHLRAAGHEVRVVSYDRGARNLADEFDVFETVGLSIETRDNEVSVARTFAGNVRRASEGVRRLRELRRACFRDFRPDAVLTDFEPMTAWLAGRERLPLVTIDNQHRMRYMQHPLPRHLQRDARVTRAVIRSIVPRPDVSLITTFFFGDTTRESAFLFPPILRQEVRALAPTDAGHVLVYFTHGFDSFLERLRGFPRERFVVYGSEHRGAQGHLRFEAPSRDGFLADLAAARAVITTAGFTLLTESLHLGKPVLALPMRGQFEQELNALLLAEAGYGKNGREADSETLGDFLYRLPEYRERLASYPRTDDDAALCAKLDELLADDCRLAREARERRRARDARGDGVPA